MRANGRGKTEASPVWWRSITPRLPRRYILEIRYAVVTCSEKALYTELGWESLNSWRWSRRLTLFLKFVNNLIPEHTVDVIPLFSSRSASFATTMSFDAYMHGQVNSSRFFIFIVYLSGISSSPNWGFNLPLRFLKNVFVSNPPPLQTQIREFAIQKDCPDWFNLRCATTSWFPQI